eukprot:11175080-Lingulodinium_polyedra.AAC.1
MVGRVRGLLREILERTYVSSWMQPAWDGRRGRGPARAGASIWAIRTPGPGRRGVSPAGCSARPSICGRSGQ